MSKSYTILFGLTADPLHLGHEQAIINGIEYLRQKNLCLKELLLIPVYYPNLIADKKAPVASFKHRIAMCEMVANRLSKQLQCNIGVSPIEKEWVLKTGHKNYSFNTIKELNIENQLFMVSADHFVGRWPKFRQWYRWREILEYSGLLINQRPGNKINQSFIQQLRYINSEIFLLNNSHSIAVSSSEIRQRLNHKQTHEALAPDLMNYIKTHGLYRD